MEYDKKESHVRVVISDNLEKEIQQKYPQHILSFFLLRYLQMGEMRMGFGMVWDGPRWARMGGWHKTEESCPGEHTSKMSESVRR